MQCAFSYWLYAWNNVILWVHCLPLHTLEKSVYWIYLYCMHIVNTHKVINCSIRPSYRIWRKCKLAHIKAHHFIKSLHFTAIFSCVMGGRNSPVCLWSVYSVQLLPTDNATPENALYSLSCTFLYSRTMFFVCLLFVKIILQNNPLFLKSDFVLAI